MRRVLPNPLLALVAVGGVFLAGCGNEAESQKKDGEKFVGGKPPPGFVEERMKNREGNGEPPVNPKTGK